MALFIGSAALACNGGGGRGSTDGFATLGTATAGTAATTGTTGAPIGPASTDSTGDAPPDPTTGPSGLTATSGASTTTSAASTTTAGPNPGETGAPDPGTTGEPASTTGDPGTTGTTVPNTSGTTTTDGSGGGPGGTSTSGGGGGECAQIKCGGMLYDCGDCLDNDGDGKVDLADPECISPCDDREDTFATGIPGDNVDPCKQDCFFDGNSGAGGGDCQWNLKCDPKGPGGAKCPYDPKYNNCPADQPQSCVESCQVPNGCDCFGCCTVEVDGQSKDIFLGDPDCSLDQLELCSACTKNPDCSNDCDPDACEVCFAEDELPPGCFEPSCDGGTPCEVDDMGGSSCPEGFYCSTGCCAALIPG